MFVFEGNLRSGIGPMRIEWNNGSLIGSEGIVQRVLNEARLMEGVELGPHEGPRVRTRHLASDLSALFLIMQVFADDAVITGDVPARPSIPEGAVG